MRDLTIIDGHRVRDLAGMTFGNLYVKEFSHTNRKAYWRCLCDCGNICIIGSLNLTSGNTKSCGCLNIVSSGEYSRTKFKNYKPSEESGWKAYFNIYKSNRRKLKRREFYLTFEEFRFICSQPCFYCGLLSEIKHVSDYTVNANGLDRLDSSKGYTLDNVVSCCFRCNQSKSNLSFYEFKDWILKVYNNLSKEIYNV